MRRMIRWARGGWALSLLLTLGIVGRAGAIYLDEDQNISLRARVYSQGSIRTEDSYPNHGTVPETKTGQLVQHRNFYNPELDAKLTSYTEWMKSAGLGFLAPDDFTFRVAAWGFYDGIYDYGSSQFDTARGTINSTFPVANPATDASGNPIQAHAWFLEGDTFSCPYRAASGTCFASAPNVPFSSYTKVFPNANDQNPRDIYANQNRVNELYLSYAKGPFFMRLGRQSISWGESDTIALLDQNNPFDVTLGAPGVFEDLDEARIPLWTIRSSLNLFETLGPFSSGFVEAYWVPGDIDTNTGILPILGASPYSPRGTDPQGQVGVLPYQFVLLDQVPKERFGNSRWGVRLQSVIAREYTVSAWYYTHFPNAPVPLALGASAIEQPNPANPSTTQRRTLSTIATVHRLTSVIGAAGTFFLEPLDGIVRLEAEYFDNEPGFVAEKNLLIGGTVTDTLQKPGFLQYSDILRWEIGYDRFFFMRPLNPSNSFTMVSAIVGSYNLDETPQRDFRQNGQRKPVSFEAPPGTAPVPDDFVQQKTVEMFGQVHLQTDYLHGRLSPGITYIQNVRGTYAVLPNVTYRWTDWLLFGLNYVHIGGEYQQLGFFRDRDQVTLRATYQLN